MLSLFEWVGRVTANKEFLMMALPVTQTQYKMYYKFLQKHHRAHHLRFIILLGKVPKPPPAGARKGHNPFYILPLWCPTLFQTWLPPCLWIIIQHWQQTKWIYTMQVHVTHLCTWHTRQYIIWSNYSCHYGKYYTYMQTCDIVPP